MSLISDEDLMGLFVQDGFITLEQKCAVQDYMRSNRKSLQEAVVELEYLRSDTYNTIFTFYTRNLSSRLI